MSRGLFDDLGPPPTDGPYRERPRVTVPARDPKVSALERPRLSAQCEAILSRLRLGRATNVELAAISLKYTSRNSDIRAAGYDLRCVVQNKVTGEAAYALFENGVEVGADFTN